MLIELSTVPVPLRYDDKGVVRVCGSRIPLDTVVDYYKLGESPEEIVVAFPTLAIADVCAILAYYLRHRAEVDNYVDENRRAAEEIRRKIEKRSPQVGLREKLLARRAGLGG